MPVPDLFQIYTDPFNRERIDYMVTGSVAAMIYGEPRFTNDIDLVIHLDIEQAQKLASIFPLDSFYVPPIESLRTEILRLNRGHFNLVHHESGFRADIYLTGRDPLHRWAMAQRRNFELAGHRLWVAPPEYVVIRKLEFYLEGGSQKHLEDIRSMVQVTAIDRAVLEAWLTPKAFQNFKEIEETQTDGWA